MNDKTNGRRTPRLQACLLVTVAGVALLAAACGSSKSPASAGSTAAASSQLAYAACMRSHGVTKFPDPSSNGSFVVSPGGNGSGYDPNSKATRQAAQACRHLLPNGGQHNPQQQQQTLSQDLKYAQCMRAHGVTKFPDPSANSQGGVNLLLPSSIDINSQQYKSAGQACQSLAPQDGSGT